MSDTVAVGHLRAFVERIERLEAEIKKLNADKSEVYQEAKGTGFNVKVLRKVVAARRQDRAEREEIDSLFDMYMTALEGGESGLVRAHVEIIEEFDAETGEITEQPETATQSETAHPRPTTPLAARGADESAAPHPHPLPTSPAADQPGAGDPLPLASGTLSDEAVPAFLKPKKTAADYLPNCQNPGNCAGIGLHHCYQCKKAMAESEAA